MTKTNRCAPMLFGAASAVALAAVAAPALAQTSAAQAAEAGQGNEAQVVVVAQHTTTRLQKIPVAASVFTSAARDRTGMQSF